MTDSKSTKKPKRSTRDLIRARLGLAGLRDLKRRLPVILKEATRDKPKYVKVAVKRVLTATIIDLEREYRRRTR